MPESRSFSIASQVSTIVGASSGRRVLPDQPSTSACGQCIKYRSIYSTPRALNDASNAAATLSCSPFALRGADDQQRQGQRASGWINAYSLVVTKTSERGTPDSRIARPTSSSFSVQISALPPCKLKVDIRTISVGRVKVAITDLKCLLHHLVHACTPAGRAHPASARAPSAARAVRPGLTHPSPTLGTRTPLLKVQRGTSTAAVMTTVLYRLCGLIMLPRLIRPTSRVTSMIGTEEEPGWRTRRFA
jgi:hypothetical protein